MTWKVPRAALRYALGRRRRPLPYSYLLGTPFCGSTLFGQALGAHSALTYLGEVDRLVRYPPEGWIDQPEPSCHYCELRGEVCPMWTPDRVRAVRTVPHGEMMRYFESELHSSGLVDGSKHPGWLRHVLELGAGEAPVAVFVTVRSPFAFCNSYRRATGAPFWEAGNAWRDVYYDAMRLVTTVGLPFLVVPHEKFAVDPEPLLRRACDLLGLPYEADMRLFRNRPTHDIGGNLRAHLPGSGEGLEYAGTGSAHVSARSLATIPPPTRTSTAEPFGGEVDDRWLSSLPAEAIEEVLQTPGLVDVANVLGYELTREVAAWQRRQSGADSHPHRP